MSDPRLNNLMTLHINRDILPSTVDIANEFIDRSEYRKLVFGNAIYVWENLCISNYKYVCLCEEHTKITHLYKFVQPNKNVNVIFVFPKN